MPEVVGKEINRVDGIAKVKGIATYSAEFPVKEMLYGVLVQSTISKGKIKNIDTKEAAAIPGFKIITYQNALKLQPLKSGNTTPGKGKLGEKNLLPLQSNEIFYNGQHIAIALAESFEMAEWAAKLIRIEYEEDKPLVNLKKESFAAYTPQQGLGGSELQVERGNAEKALKESPVSVIETYTTPVYHHNAMEPHATMAYWNNDQLTVYDSTQSVVGSRNAIADMLGMPHEKVRLVSLYIGGGFGSKGFSWPHSVLTAMAAKIVDRPVKIVLDRSQMFTGNGRRSATIQQISLGAEPDGKLKSVIHSTLSETSFVDEFVEAAGVATKHIYNCADLQVKQQLVKLNRGTPCPTRAPGEAVGTFALEAALDELSYKLKMDPVDLRIVNHADNNPHTGQPWSSKNLLDCYRRGKELIEWEKRNPLPGSMKEGKYLVGFGMATAIYPGNRGAASAKVRIYPDGHVAAACCTQDIGTGTYTILKQVVAEALDVVVEKIEMKLGDTNFPEGPNSGGSQTAASAGPALRAAAIDAREKIIQAAVADKKSALYNQAGKEIIPDKGKLVLKDDTIKSDTYSAILQRNKLNYIEGSASITVSTRETDQKKPADPKKPNPNHAAAEDEAIDRKKYAFQSFGAHFVKVLVNPFSGEIRVSRIVSVMDIGKVMNPKLAKNQIMGGALFALGMALMEQTEYDDNTGRIVTKDLANYLIPVHADTPEFTVEFIDKPDPYISPIGARGIGEIGITGTAAAIANAVYHATGQRIRDLPITPDKLINNLSFA